MPLTTGPSVEQLAARVEDAQKRLRGMSDSQLTKESRGLAFDFQAGKKTAEIVEPAFALVREVSKRTMGMEHFPVQLFAGYNMMFRNIVEMDTGEGKTLTAVLPLYLHSLKDNGVLLSTANDYLAARDAEEMTPIFTMLGRSVGVVQQASGDLDRVNAYRCDITYGTAGEFGFDLLRDRIKHREGREAEMVGRSRLFAMVVDEADSLLIDEATTPLVIASAAPSVLPHIETTFRWAAANAPRAIEGQHYSFDKRQDKVELTKVGRGWVQRLRVPAGMTGISMLDCYDYIERAIKVQRNFHRDQQYVIANNEVRLVDEQTGRFAEGREWHDGIQQAVQSKEGVEITMPSGQQGRMTLQTFFLSFEHLSGMTGTAKQAAREFGKVYKMKFVRIPPNRKNLRKTYATKVFKTESEKFAAIAKETEEQIQAGRSVLIGTRSIEASWRLSAALTERSLEHRVLNASQSENEAEIISEAGQPGRITIATNMAGRGTDVKVAPSVKEAGGMHVIVSELADSFRIDRQLIGRTARQGDPGSYRIFLSGDDEILRSARGLQATPQGDEKNPTKEVIRASTLFQAQSMVDRLNEARRKALFSQEKKRLQQLEQGGFDPLLDIVD